MTCPSEASGSDEYVAASFHRLLAWFVAGVVAVAVYVVLGVEGVSLWMTWPLLVVMNVSIWKCWTWGA